MLIDHFHAKAKVILFLIWGHQTSFQLFKMLHITDYLWAI
jgi:hypothetical protein